MAISKCFLTISSQLDYVQLPLQLPFLAVRTEIHRPKRLLLKRASSSRV